MTHDHTPAFLAEADQVAAGFKEGVTALVELARKYLAEGDDEMHAAATVAHGLSIAATVPQLASLVGFAVTRIIELEDRAAAECPCTPDAPKHEHLTGGYRLLVRVCPRCDHDVDALPVGQVCAECAVEVRQLSGHAADCLACTRTADVDDLTGHKLAPVPGDQEARS